MARFWTAGSLGVEWCKIYWRFTNKPWGWEGWLLCSLWPRLLWILRFGLDGLPDSFHWRLSQFIINIHPCYIRRNLNHVMTRPLIATACTAVALFTVFTGCRPINRIYGIFNLSPTSAIKFQLSAMDRSTGSNWYFSPITYCQPTGRRSVVGDHRR